MSQNCIVGCDLGSSKYTLSSAGGNNGASQVIENELSKKSTPYN